MSVYSEDEWFADYINKASRTQLFVQPTVSSKTSNTKSTKDGKIYKNKQTHTYISTRKILTTVRLRTVGLSNNIWRERERERVYEVDENKKNELREY